MFLTDLFADDEILLEASLPSILLSSKQRDNGKVLLDIMAKNRILSNNSNFVPVDKFNKNRTTLFMCENGIGLYLDSENKEKTLDFHKTVVYVTNQIFYNKYAYVRMGIEEQLTHSIGDILQRYECINCKGAAKELYKTRAARDPEYHNLENNEYKLFNRILKIAKPHIIKLQDEYASTLMTDPTHRNYQKYFDKYAFIDNVLQIQQVDKSNLKSHTVELLLKYFKKAMALVSHDLASQTKLPNDLRSINQFTTIYDDHDRYIIREINKGDIRLFKLLLDYFLGALFR